MRKVKRSSRSKGGKTLRGAERPLFPPLAAIERERIGLSDQLILRALTGDLPPHLLEKIQHHPDWATVRQNAASTRADGEASPFPDETVEVRMEGGRRGHSDASRRTLPQAMHELIQRHVSLREARLDPPPKVGQIVRIDRLPPAYEERMDHVLASPLYVLLDGPDEGTDPDLLWWGWLCAPETDYASWWDHVLQEEDGPFSPEVGMVQVWNGVHVPVALLREGKVVGQLTDEALRVIRALTAEFLTGREPCGASQENMPMETGEPAPMPGTVAVRQTLNGVLVVTGSPLGDPDWDPRHRYQEIYLLAAETLREVSKIALAETVEAVEAERSLDLLRSKGPSEPLVARLKALWWEWWEELPRKLPTLIPEPAVPVAMAEEGEVVALYDYRWQGLRFHLDPDRWQLHIFHEGQKEVEVVLFDWEGLVIDRRQLAPGTSYPIELDRADLSAIRIRCGEDHLEINLPGSADLD